MATKNDILNAVDQVKEHLALNKSQDAIKLMAQISVAIIENLTDEALIVSKGYEEDLKALENGGIINDSTAHNLETLIVSGVQANNGVDVPKDYVNKAFEVLNDEIDIIYNKNKNENIMPAEQANMVEDKKPMYDEINIDEDEPVFLTQNGEKDFRAKEKFRKGQLTKTLLHNKRKLSKLIAIIIPIILIIVVAIIIKGCVSGAGDDTRRYQETYETPFDITSEEPTTEETEPETTSVAGPYIVTGDIVWIRDQATTSSKKLEYRNKGDVVNVLGFYDDDWAIISYEGKEAFISRQYIYKQED